MYCMKCGAQMPDDVKFCPKCGESVLPVGNTDSPTEHKAYPAGKWICGHCEHANALGNVKCSVCGAAKTTQIYSNSSNVNIDKYLDINFGSVAKAWFVFCIIVNIITAIFSVFADVDDDLIGIMFLSILVSVAVAVGYIGLLAKKQKRYMYVILSAALVNMGISCIGLETEIKYAILSLINPCITYLILVWGGSLHSYWSDMDT